MTNRAFQEPELSYEERLVLENKTLKEERDSFQTDFKITLEYSAAVERDNKALLDTLEKITEMYDPKGQDMSRAMYELALTTINKIKNPSE